MTSVARVDAASRGREVRHTGVPYPFPSDVNMRLLRSGLPGEGQRRPRILPDRPGLCAPVRLPSGQRGCPPDYGDRSNVAEPRPGLYWLSLRSPRRIRDTLLV